MQWAILIGLAWRRERGVGRGRNGYLLAPLSGIQRTRDRRTLVPPVRPKNAPDRRHGTHQTRERSVFYIPMHPNASPAWIVLRRLEGWPCGRQRQANIYQRPAPENLHHIKRNEVNPMRRIVLLALAAIGLGLALPPVASEAKGCIKGAIAGGIAGHYAGHHSFLGAVSGCISGRRTAKRRARAHPTKSVPPTDATKIPR